MASSALPSLVLLHAMCSSRQNSLSWKCWSVNSKAGPEAAPASSGAMCKVHRTSQLVPTACPGRAAPGCNRRPVQLQRHRAAGSAMLTWPNSPVCSIPLQAAEAITCTPPQLGSCRAAGQSLLAAYKVFRPSGRHVHQIFQVLQMARLMWLAGGTPSTPRSAIWPTGPLGSCSCAQPSRGGGWQSSSLRGAPTGDRLPHSRECQLEAPAVSALPASQADSP